MRKYFLMMAMAFASTVMFAQGAKNIKINEVLTNNIASLQDDVGRRLPWLELANTSFSTYNVRGMFITTNRKVLDTSLSAPERMRLMSIIPSGDERTLMKGQQHLVFFLNSYPAAGTTHLKSSVNAGKPTWVALYDGNGIDLIDSVTVPALGENMSYARVKDGSSQWEVKNAETVTPQTKNHIGVNESKVAKLKTDDPYGIGITVLSMGIVFACLTLLYAFFTIFGKYVVAKKREKKARPKISKYPNTATAQDKLPHDAMPNDAELAVAVLALNEEMATYAAVIALALKQYKDDIHDDEPDVITIAPHDTRWGNSLNAFSNFS